MRRPAVTASQHRGIRLRNTRGLSPLVTTWAGSEGLCRGESSPRLYPTATPLHTYTYSYSQRGSCGCLHRCHTHTSTHTHPPTQAETEPGSPHISRFRGTRHLYLLFYTLEITEHVAHQIHVSVAGFVRFQGQPGYQMDRGWIQ